MPVGGHEVEPAVVVGIQERRAEAQPVPARGRQADRGRVIGEEALAQVAEERRGLAVEVGDRQVGPPVAVEVAAGDAHARLVTPTGVGRHPRNVTDFLEPESPQVPEEEVRRAVVGDEEVDPAVVVEVGGHHAQAPAIVVDDPASAVTSTNRPPSLRKTWSGSASSAGVAGEDMSRWVRADPRIRGFPDAVVADIQVEVPVVVQISERRRGRPVAIAPQPGLRVTSSNVPSPRLRYSA